jgi:hypothetical protein
MDAEIFNQKFEEIPELKTFDSKIEVDADKLANYLEKSTRENLQKYEEWVLFSSEKAYTRILGI